jgi:23S rRNA pseudouridine2605 synthase
MRINRFLASAGIGSRRKCEDLIREGRVRINGEMLTALARFIDTDSDSVTIDGRTVESVRHRMILVLNKPLGVLSTASDDRGRKTVVGLARDMGYSERLFPVGRLDRDTTGLLLLTNDGDLAYRLTHPRYKIEKRYLVRVEGLIDDRTVESIASGVDLGDYITRPCAVRIVARSSGSSTLEISLKEGKKRQIRRMFSESGHKVLELRRVALGDLEFADLEPGDIRPLTEEEDIKLRELTGLS